MLGLLLPARRRARRGESFIETYEFPPSVRTKFERDAPDVDWEPVEQGLREWLICCAYRRRVPLGMPSRAVDYAWHSFILDTAAYREFCEGAYGRFLDHIPDTAMSGNSRCDYETVWAWDRSRAATRGDSILWTLDDRLEVDEPLGISISEIATARTHDRSRLGGCGGA